MLTRLNARLPTYFVPLKQFGKVHKIVHSLFVLENMSLSKQPYLEESEDEEDFLRIKTIHSDDEDDDTAEHKTSGGGKVCPSQLRMSFALHICMCVKIRCL